MTVVLPWVRGRGRGRRRADEYEVARRSFADAVVIAQRNRAARIAWEERCRQAVRDSGPALPRPRPAIVLVIVSAGVIVSH